MPAPGTRAENCDLSRDPIEILIGGPGIQRNLAAEISALRDEIAELRKELKPVPSLIVTGQRALDAFERLTREA